VKSYTKIEYNKEKLETMKDIKQQTSEKFWYCEKYKQSRAEHSTAERSRAEQSRGKRSEVE
jgi:oligoribonuclease (3'-5' exoribonuclease)